MFVLDNNGGHPRVCEAGEVRARAERQRYHGAIRPSPCSLRVHAGGHQHAARAHDTEQVCI